MAFSYQEPTNCRQLLDCGQSFWMNQWKAKKWHFSCFEQRGDEPPRVDRTSFDTVISENGHQYCRFLENRIINIPSSSFLISVWKSDILETDHDHINSKNLFKKVYQYLSSVQIRRKGSCFKEICRYLWNSFFSHRNINNNDFLEKVNCGSRFICFRIIIKS